VRNGAAYLAPALRSLAEQTFIDYEAIVIDNESHDGTDEILTNWAERDRRFRICRSGALGLVWPASA
jgi:CDP-glycerol glycerophosphotransferase